MCRLSLLYNDLITMEYDCHIPEIPGIQIEKSIEISSILIENLGFRSKY